MPMADSVVVVDCGTGETAERPLSTQERDTAAAAAAGAGTVEDAQAVEHANETSVRDKAAQALSANISDAATNDAFLAIANPTNAQTVTQVKELTRQSTRQARELNALIRLALRRFDATD